MLTETTHARAQAAYDCLERAERPDGDSFIRVKDGSPEWVTELVHEAHGDFLPDDWRYECIRAALEFIADSEDPEDDASEFADGTVDTYNAARTAWLASSLYRAAYCEEAVREFGPNEDGDIFKAIGMGQYMEALEVYALVLERLA